MKLSMLPGTSPRIARRDEPTTYSLRVRIVTVRRCSNRSRWFILLMAIDSVCMQKTVRARANGFQIGFHAVTLTHLQQGFFSCVLSARNDGVVISGARLVVASIPPWDGQ